MTAAAGTLHPESVDGEPLEVRWVVPAGTLPFVGTVARAPEALQALVDGDVLAAVVAEPVAIRTRLGAGRTWRSEGGSVRAAVAAALVDVEGWVPATAGSADDVLRAAVEEVLAGEVGAYIRSHGGALEVQAVRDGRVTMRFSGACAHCPASDWTLTNRFEAAVRARCPGLLGVETVRSAAAAAGSRFIGIPFRRRP